MNYSICVQWRNRKQQIIKNKNNNKKDRLRTNIENERNIYLITDALIIFLVNKY